MPSLPDGRQVIVFFAYLGTFLLRKNTRYDTKKTIVPRHS